FVPPRRPTHAHPLPLHAALPLSRRTERRDGGIHDDGERGREETGLERRVTPRLPVELHGPRRTFEHVDAYGAPAGEPQAPRAVRDRKSTRLTPVTFRSRMPSSA